MNDRLGRLDVVEKRSKCAICGYELTYPEYILDNKCVFHGALKRTEWGICAWIAFAWQEYRVYARKLNMAKRGLTEQDYFACLGVHKNEDIGNVKDAYAMGRLLKELKNYKKAAL